MINIHKSKSGVWVSQITKIKVNCRNRQKITESNKNLTEIIIKRSKITCTCYRYMFIGFKIVITFITASNIPMISSKNM